MKRRRARRNEAREFLATHVHSTSAECIHWPFGLTAGYGQINVNGQPMLASRRMCLLAHGDPPFPMAEAAHSCGNPICINPNHIRWATDLDNSRDRKVHGTEPLGEDRPNAKLNEAAVRAIRDQLSLGTTIAALAREYGVCRISITDVRDRKRWRHVV